MKLIGFLRISIHIQSISHSLGGTLGSRPVSKTSHGWVRIPHHLPFLDENSLVWFDSQLFIIMEDYRKFFCENSICLQQKLKSIVKNNKLIFYECYICKNLGFHLNKPLNLQLDHINGISNDNRLENLRWLCPNCHSQTENYAGRNRRGKSKKKFITEQLILDSISTVNNINQLLLKIEASNTNGNYKKVKFVMSKYGLKFNNIVTLQILDKKRKRKFIRPSKEILEKEIIHSPMVEIGKKYGVSDNSIRKWCKCYGIMLPKFGRGYWSSK